MAARRTLPAEPTSFVGRQAELLRIEEAFASGARLVTLLGPPGIGKSRLALRFAARCLAAGAPPEGVVACELAFATSADDLCAALSRALDVVASRRPRGGDLVAELGVLLGDALVLLDNAEQLVGVGPETIGRWLAIAPRVRFVVTSRERLHLAGEVVLELGPLSLPEDGTPPERSEAVQLFVERARAVRPQLALTADNAEAIAEIVRQLDGIPLAIELGATRMAVLGPAGLLARLPRRFDVLSAAIRNPAARQRTLREAIDASFALLSPVEQSVLAQVSVFRGGFDLDAAERVVDLGLGEGAPAAGEAPPLLDVLQSLVDKSLIFTRASTVRPDEVRFGLYTSIREYARERLEASGAAPAVLARYVAYFLDRAASAGNEADGAAELERALWIAQETNDLTAVHGHLVAAAAADPARAADALRVALALGAALGRWGPISHLRAMLDDALRAARDAGARLPDDLLLRGLVARGDACRLLGRSCEALADHEAAHALAERLGDRRTQAIAAVGIGMTIRELGRLPEAQRWLDGALPELRASGARRVEVHARTALERIHTVLGHGDEARAHHAEMRRLLGSERDRELVASSLASAATLAIAEGRLEEAELDIAKVQAEVHELSSPSMVALAMSALAFLRQEQGRLAEARAAAEAIVAYSRKIGCGRNEGFALGQLGTVLAEMGDLAAARDALARGVASLRETGDVRAAAFFTAVLAAITARLGHGAEAARLFASLDEPLAEVGDPMLVAAIDVYRAVAAPGRAARVIEATRGAASRSHHVRTGLRILAAASGARATDEAAAGPPPEGALVVSPDARWCRLPDGREIAFRRGRALRLILLRLLEERLAAPGRALPLAALFESGWPGEKAAGEARDNRVYVSLSRLRKLGFSGLVQSRDDGFLLDPSVPVFRAVGPT